MILIIIILILIPIESNNKCSFNENEKAYKDNNFWIITNFDKLDSLNFNCINPVNMSMLGLKPNKPVVLDNSLNLKGLKIQPINEIIDVLFENFKGFDLKSNPFKNVKFLTKYYKIWSISYSNFEFYDKNVSVNRNCDENLLNGISDVNQFDGNMLCLEEGTKFFPNTCPIIFFNINLDTFILNRISSNLIETNIFEFQNVSHNLLKNINATIWHFQIKIYHSDLTSKLLNKYIFGSLNILDLNGQIKQIEEKLFLNLNNLHFLRIKTQNIQNIFVKNNKWLNYINNAINIDPKNHSHIVENRHNALILILDQIFYNLTFYDYPEKDFCYFKTFPHHRLVLPNLRPITNSKSTCSCTEIFLIQYSAYFSEQINSMIDQLPYNYYLTQYYEDFLINENKFSKCLNKTFSQRIKDCNFKKRIDLCNIKTIETKKTNEKVYFYMNDWNTLSKYSHLILSIYINPIISIISILFNLFTLAILSSKQIAKEMNRMYNYLKINSVLNIIFMIIRLFKLIDTCSTDDIICITINSKSKSIQYFKIIFIQIIGNSFQSASNLAHVTYTLSRYLTVSNNKSPLFAFIHKISYVKYLFAILLLSLILNIHIFFEHSILNETSQMNQFKLFDFKKFNIYKQESFDDYKEKFDNSEYTLLSMFQYIKIIFSDLFYILISFIIDLILLLFVKKSMIKKQSLTIKFLVNVNRVVINSTGIGNTERDKQKKINSLKNRITLMIILNGLNFLLLRLPLALISFYGFIFRYDNNETKYKPNLTMYLICRYFRFCFSLNSFCYFIYLNSFIIQFFIFFKLDKNFKNIFKSYKNYLKQNVSNIFSFHL